MILLREQRGENWSKEVCEEERKLLLSWTYVRFEFHHIHNKVAYSCGHAKVIWFLASPTTLTIQIRIWSRCQRKICLHSFLSSASIPGPGLLRSFPTWSSQCSLGILLPRGFPFQICLIMFILALFLLNMWSSHLKRLLFTTAYFISGSV